MKIFIAATMAAAALALSTPAVAGDDNGSAYWGYPNNTGIYSRYDEYNYPGIGDFTSCCSDGYSGYGDYGYGYDRYGYDSYGYEPYGYDDASDDGDYDWGYDDY
jgi:hypothetical protein